MTEEDQRKEYGYNHRAASEYLHLAVTDDDNIMTHLETAIDYETKAKQYANNWRERLLFEGLIHTAENIQAMLQAGVRP